MNFIEYFSISIFKLNTYLSSFVLRVCKMGKHFGELAVIRGIVYYKLSPHEQKPFAGAMTYGLPNMVPRITATILYWLPPFLLGYAIYKGVEEAHWQSKRKNLKDYENEVDPDEGKCKPKK